MLSWFQIQEVETNSSSLPELCSTYSVPGVLLSIFGIIDSILTILMKCSMAHFANEWSEAGDTYIWSSWSGFCHLFSQGSPPLESLIGTQLSFQRLAGFSVYNYELVTILAHFLPSLKLPRGGYPVLCSCADSGLGMISGIHWICNKCCFARTNFPILKMTISSLPFSQNNLQDQMGVHGFQ